MDYAKIYHAIIDNRKQNLLEGYTEKHHIIPKSLGGTNEKTNLVRLLPREHFICHYLLSKMYRRNTRSWHKMNHAFMMMKASNSNQKRYFNSRLYAALRDNFSKVMSNLNRGENNPTYGKRWIYNMELRQSIRILKEDALPEGWLEGRVINFDLKLDKEENPEKYLALARKRYKEKSSKRTKKLKNRNKKRTIDNHKISKREINQEAASRRANELFKKFIKSDSTSIREFCRNGHYDKSHVSLTKMWKKYIKEYNPLPNRSFKKGK